MEQPTQQGTEPSAAWITLAEAAAYLGKPKSWMYDNYKRLQIPHTLLETHPRFSREQLDKWMLSRMQYRFDFGLPGSGR